MFENHIVDLKIRYSRALEICNFQSLVIQAGNSHLYFLDDQNIPFRPNPFFSHWCPERSPGHLLQISIGKKPRLIYFQPKDYWHKPPSLENSDWSTFFEIIVIEKIEEAWDKLKIKKNTAFIGEDTKTAKSLGLDCEAKSLNMQLSWIRAKKNEYEINCIEAANKSAARGHLAAKKTFEEGGSELDIHLAFLKAIPTTEASLPYPSIVGLDKNSAVLHYQEKLQKKFNAKLLLIDCGTNHRGYASDITRTYLKSNPPTELKHALESLNIAQQELANKALADKPFKELNRETHLAISKILIDINVVKGLSSEECVSKGVSQFFMPHGLGHMLGLQVHDVGGDQADANGGEILPCKDFPKLRMRRPLIENEIITIEPGIYFIPMKLQELSKNVVSKNINWQIIEELVPLGGIRIEDNILVKEGKSINITRKFLP